MHRTGLRNPSSRNDSWNQLLRLAALVGCTGILVHSFADFNLQILANALFFYFGYWYTAGAQYGRKLESSVSRGRRTGVLVHSFADFNLQIPANVLFFQFLCAIATGRPANLRNGPGCSWF